MNEDRELIERSLKGEKRAFEMIIQKYQHSIVNYVGRMVGERELALDLSQEVFLKVYSSLPSYQPQYKFSTWLFKIASNLVIDFWRKKKLPTFSLNLRDEDDLKSRTLEVPDDGPSVVKKFELEELRVRIEEVLESIPVTLKELFVWRHINGLSYEEIAEIKDQPVGTVKNKVFQAKELIRKKMEEKG